MSMTPQLQNLDNLIGKEVVATYIDGKTVRGRLDFHGRDELLLVTKQRKQIVIFKSNLRKMEVVEK